MKVIELRNAFGLENLAMGERPTRALGAYEVRVRMHAASLNYRDLLTVTGLYNPKQALPLIPCSDGAGKVIELGAAVSRVAIGARVATLFAQTWLAGKPTLNKLRNTLGGPLDGVLAEECILHEDGVVEFPQHLDFKEAATLPCAALTAWSALEQAGVTAGQTVLVQGTGGVSLFALQFARLRGAKVIATSKSDAKLELAKKLGAHACINYVQVPEWGKQARKLTDGEGVDVVVEVGGGGTLAQSIRCTKPGGTVALIGVLAGTATELQLTPVLMQNLRIQGVIVGHREGMEAMHRAIGLAELRPAIDPRRFDFAEAAEALRYVGAGEHFGKVVLQIA